MVVVVVVVVGGGGAAAGGGAYYKKKKGKGKVHSQNTINSLIMINQINCIFLPNDFI